MIETDAQCFPFEVDDLDADTLLAHASDSETAVWIAERRRLRLAHQWCVLHPAGDGDAATWGDAGIKGTGDWEETLGGDGSPTVAAFTAEPFAAALGLTPYAGMLLLADALDLRHRLPRIWEQVESLQIPAWKARQVAQATRLLSRRAAAFVDERLTARTQGFGTPPSPNRSPRPSPGPPRACRGTAAHRTEVVERAAAQVDARHQRGDLPPRRHRLLAGPAEVLQRRLRRSSPPPQGRRRPRLPGDPQGQGPRRHRRPHQRHHRHDHHRRRHRRHRHRQRRGRSPDEPAVHRGLAAPSTSTPPSPSCSTT